MSYALEVKKFTDACHNNLPQVPTPLTKEQVKFITKMVNDELKELDEAKDVTGQADALVDAIYYILDQSVRSGIDLDPLFAIVSGANQSKIVDGKVIRREDGKIMKPKGWVDPKPLLQKEMEDQEKYGSWNKVTFYDNGKVKSITPKNGIGYHVEYHDNGNGKVKYNTDKNGIQGEQFTYYNNGAIMSRYNYKDGELDGQCITYEENGTISSISVYKDCDRVSFVVFNTDGTTAFSGK